MPSSYLIDDKRGIVFSRGWGVLTDDDAADHAATLKADPRLQAHFKQIVDFRELGTIALTSAGIRKCAAINPFPRDARRAFVVASDEAYGLSRMFAQFAEADPDQFTIFREIEPGMAWIGLDPKTPWPDKAPDKMFGAR